MSKILVPLLLTAALAAQAPTWHPLTTSPVPQAVAYDAVRGCLVMIGPAGDQHLWEWDGSAVRERLDALVGQPEVEHLTIDPLTGTLYAKSAGQVGGQLIGRWRNGAFDWRGGGVPPFGPTWIAFDWFRSRLVCCTTWASSSTTLVHEWDGQQWWLVASGGPSARTGAAFAFDPTVGKCVLYGGDDGAPRSDTWTWDGLTWQLHSTISAPGPRTHAAMSFDTTSNRFVLYGGSNDTAVWSWVAGQWQQVATANDPGARSHHHLLDTPQGLLLVPGTAHDLNTNFDPTAPLWRLSGNTWQVLDHFPVPAGRTNANVAFDRARGEFVMFGGTLVGGSTTDLTLRFDGRQWRHATSATEPAHRYSSPLCWSNPDHGLLLFGGDSYGGLLGDTWAWIGTGWQQRQPAHSPPPRYNHALVEDPTGGVMLFGGRNATTFLGDQWLWDGSDWSQLQPTVAPSPRARPLAVLDENTHEVLLYGGTGSAGRITDTWIWNGTSWAVVATGAYPNNPYTIAFDPNANRILVGGFPDFTWTGSAWTQEPTNSANMWTRFAVDVQRQRLLAFDSSNVSLLTATRAAVTAYGVGCATIEAPRLAAIDEPVIASTFFAELACPTAGAPAFLIAGFGAQSVPVGGGCQSLVQQQAGVLFAITDATGAARWPISIPATPALRSVVFHLQGAAYEPARSTFGGVTLTPGLAVTVGD